MILICFLSFQLYFSGISEIPAPDVLDRLAEVLNAILAHEFELPSCQEPSYVLLDEDSNLLELSMGSSFLPWIDQFEYLSIFDKLVLLFVFNYEALFLHILLIAHHKWHVIIYHNSLEDWHRDD